MKTIGWTLFGLVMAACMVGLGYVVWDGTRARGEAVGKFDVGAAKPEVSASRSSKETEVSSRATRRRFTAEYKKKILDELDALTERGEVGALLRREGLYSSHVTAWRAERRAGELSGLEPKKRGPKPKEANPLVKELEAKEREIAHLKAENAKLASSARSKKKSRSSWG